MDGYRPKIEVRRDVRDHPTRLPHDLYVQGEYTEWLNDAEADAWEQYAADAEVGARLRIATGDGVRAERAKGEWPNAFGFFVVRLIGDDLNGVRVLGIRTEADADTLIAQLNSVSVGGDVPSDPSTEGMLVRSGQWLIDNDPDGQTWERWAAPDWWRCAIDLEDSPRPEFIYVVRRIVPPPAPPEPEVEKVDWHVAMAERLPMPELGGEWPRMVVPMGASPLGVGLVAERGPELPIVAIPADGTVTVLRDPSTSPDNPEEIR